MVVVEKAFWLSWLCKILTNYNRSLFNERAKENMKNARAASCASASRRRPHYWDSKLALDPWLLAFLEDPVSHFSFSLLSLVTSQSQWLRVVLRQFVRKNRVDFSFLSKSVTTMKQFSFKLPPQAFFLFSTTINRYQTVHETQRSALDESVCWWLKYWTRINWRMCQSCDRHRHSWRENWEQIADWVSLRIDWSCSHEMVSANR